MMGAMGSMRGRRAIRARAIGVTAGVLAGALVIGLAAWRSSDQAPDSPGRHDPGATERPPAAGPLVFYEVLDGAGSRLLERRLDGTSLARVVAARSAVGYGRTWTVDPHGTTAIARIPGHDDQGLEALDVATGDSRWSIRTPDAAVDQAVWATDGSRFALTTIGSDAAPRELLIVEASSGTEVRVVIPDDSIVQGFASDGALILRRHLPSSDGENVGWQLLGVDPMTRVIQPLTILPDVGPASDSSEDLDPASGVGMDVVLSADREARTVRIWRLRGGGAPTDLVTMPSVDRIAIDPAGTGVAISADGSIRFVTFEGRSSEVFRGDDPIADFTWSVGGDYLAVATDRHGPNVTIVERATGRSVALPHPDVVAQILVVRVVGGVPLPASPLPAVEPTASPTAGPDGPDVEGFAGVLSAWIDAAGSSRVVRLERLIPTESGGLRVAAVMPPIDLGPAAVTDEDGPEVRLLPRPGSSDILVWVATSERATGHVWDGATSLRPLELPADWPDIAFDVAWRPDGEAIAASAARSTGDGAFEAVFVIAASGDRRTTVVPVVGEYDRLEGWWSASELRVGHGICFDACADRYAWSAHLRIQDRRLVEMTPADRARAPIDELSVDGTSILLSAVSGDTDDDVRIAWPAAFGPIEAVEPIGFAGDGRSLLVAVPGPDGTDVDRISDPIGRAVGGRVADPEVERLVHLDGGDLRVDVSTDGAWALVTDRVESVRLVRIADGRSWPVDRKRILEWAAGS